MGMANQAKPLGVMATDERNGRPEEILRVGLLLMECGSWFYELLLKNNSRGT